MFAGGKRRGTGDLPAFDPAVILKIFDLQKRLSSYHDEARLAGRVVDSVAKFPGVDGCVLCIEGKTRSAGSLRLSAPPRCSGRALETEELSLKCEEPCPLESESGLVRLALSDSENEEYGALILKGESGLKEYRPLLEGLVDYISLLIMDERKVKRLTEMNSLLEDELEKQKAAIKEAERNYRHLFEDLGVGLGVSDRSGRVLAANKAMTEITGYSLEEFAQINLRDTYVNIEDRKKLLEKIEREGSAEGFEVQLKRKGGETYWASITVRPIKYNGKDAFLTFVFDVTERRNAEEALRDSETRYRTLFENANDAIFLMDEDMFIECNDATISMFGCESKGDILGHSPWEFSPEKQPDGQPSRKKAITLIRRALAGEPQRFYWKHSKKDGTLFDAEVSLNSITLQGKTFLQAIVRDITERMRAEEERIRLEQQFHQVQRLESIGRLAGGVAHDYNNMLNVIIGYAELALRKVDSTDPLHEDLQEILKAAQRSSDVTRQLLAFASKQTVMPRVLDLNIVVEGVLNMLRRLIGEDIELVWRPGQNLWLVRMDPSQVDQILANLCVNARDAITGAGRVVIETGNAVVDRRKSPGNVNGVEGEFVVLSITDNGCGMDKETMKRLFEPFFTTKEVGKGTGLGLSTVYGIVRQNNGFIDVKSKPGEGTRFSIYLPRYEGKGNNQIEEEQSGVPRGHGETILVVEDEVSILKLTERILRGLGYRVLSAKSPDEALKLAEKHGKEIALLITDVVMPGMSGRDLADKVVKMNPDIKCLYMSGYTADAMVHRGILEGGVHFIKKPFSMKNLALKVWMTLRNG